jgi:biopolymer transport protein ExbB
MCRRQAARVLVFVALIGVAALSGAAAQTPNEVLPTASSSPAPQPAAPVATETPTPLPVEPGPSPAALPHNLSPLTMFRNADIVVKAVMIGLAFASFLTWSVFVAKRLHLFGARMRLVQALRALREADGLVELDRSHKTGPLSVGPVAVLVHAAEVERERSADLPPDGVKERAAIALERIEAAAVRRMNSGASLVATISSTAPFVGLFGTVWGIMNSFVGISNAHTTNLAVVAPGIAEALLATAVGLAAAIPAVVIYNGLAVALTGYKALLADAGAEVMRHLSRDLDRRVHAAE